ncbi:MAG: hypothetical protein ACYCVZ_16465 [Streptosporangiaceae bacterium]
MTDLAAGVPLAQVGEPIRRGRRVGGLQFGLGRLIAGHRMVGPIIDPIGMPPD